jgi:hypothetical protein
VEGANSNEALHDSRHKSSFGSSSTHPGSISESCYSTLYLATFVPCSGVYLAIDLVG